MTQERVGAATGISHQQIQKLEKGSNRIPASLLFDLAAVLGVDLNAFFADGDFVEGTGLEAAFRLSRAFQEIEEDWMREEIVAFVEGLAARGRKPRRRGR